jgi:hypothetical protein
MASKRNFFLRLLLGGTLGFAMMGCGDGDTPAPPIPADEVDDLGPPDIDTGGEDTTTTE